MNAPFRRRATGSKGCGSAAGAAVGASARTKAAVLMYATNHSLAANTALWQSSILPRATRILPFLLLAAPKHQEARWRRGGLRRPLVLLSPSVRMPECRKKTFNLRPCLLCFSHHGKAAWAATRTCLAPSGQLVTQGSPALPGCFAVLPACDATLRWQRVDCVSRAADWISAMRQVGYLRGAALSTYHRPAKLSGFDEVASFCAHASAVPRSELHGAVDA